MAILDNKPFFLTPCVTTHHINILALLLPWHQSFDIKTTNPVPAILALIGRLLSIDNHNPVKISKILLLYDQRDQITIFLACKILLLVGEPMESKEADRRQLAAT